MTRIGVVDTTFASVDMGGIVVRTLQANATGIRIERYTVPGIKDLAVACKRLFESGVDVCIACGMPGPEAVDKQSAHVASMGLQWAQLGASRHIVEVFVHLDEARSPKELETLCQNRASEHALNALALLKGPTALTPRAGTGQRQGYADVGSADQLRAGTNPFQARYNEAKGADPTDPGSARSEAGSKFSGSSNAGKH